MWSLLSNSAYAETKPTPATWITNGPVHAVANDGNTIYLGGDFSIAGPATGHGIPLMSAPLVAPVEDFPFINGPVFAALTDGSGGWYVGGKFTKVGDEKVTNLVHITSAKTVNKDFNFSADGIVYSLARSSDKKTLYVGGSFSQITHTKGEVAALYARANIAAINLVANDLKVTVWNPGTNGEVRALALAKDDKTLYLGGNFNTVQSSARNFLAALSSVADDRGNYVTPWAPAVTNVIKDMELTEKVLFAGGDFGIAAYDLTKNAPIWNMATDAPVQALAYQTSIDLLFAGGEFTTVATQARAKIVALKGANGEAQPGFQVTINDGAVYALALSSSDARLYIGGSFTRINDSSRHNFAAIGTDGKLIGSFQPHAMGAVRSLYAPAESAAVFVGGDFISVGGSLRSGLAALNAKTGEATPWDPKIGGGIVKSIAITSDKNHLYIGGTFTQALDKPRARLAKISTKAVALTDWDPGVDPTLTDSSVNTLSLSAGGGKIQTIVIDPKQPAVLYAGTSNGLYKSTDSAVTWAALTGFSNIAVNQLLVDTTNPGKIFAATARGLYRSSDSGTTWQRTDFAALQGNVLALALHPANPSILLAGISKTAGIAAEIYRSSDGGATWTPLPFTPAHENVSALAIDGKTGPLTAYASGTTGLWKTTDNGETWQKVRDLTAPATRLVVASGNPSVIYAAAAGTVYTSRDDGATWSAPIQGLTGAVTDIAIPPASPDIVIATTANRGVFRSLNKGETWGTTTGQLNEIPLYALAIDPANPTVLYAGGSRALLYKSTDNGFTWAESHQGIPNEILFLGGKFNSVDNQLRSNLAAIDTLSTTSGSYVTTWNPGADGEVFVSKLANDNQTLYVGGNFANMAAASRQKLAAINVGNGELLPWNPGTDGPVTSLALTANDQLLYVGGDFTLAASAIRSRLAAIDTSKAIATNWNPGSDGIVRSIALSSDEKLLFVAGVFTRLNNVDRSNLASLVTNRTTNYVTSWNPAPTPAFLGNNTLTVNGSTVFVGGSFQTISGMRRDNLAAFAFAGPTLKADPIAGAYNRALTIALKCELSTKADCGTGFQIYYSLGTSLADIPYTTPIPLADNQTIYALAIDEEGISSALTPFVYTFDYNPPTTVADLPSGRFTYTKTVGLTCIDPAENSAGCLINFYTTDGSIPALTNDVKIGQDVMFVNDLPYGLAGSTKFLTASQRIPILVDTFINFSSIDKAGNIGPIQTAQYKISRGESSGNVDGMLLLLLGAGLLLKLKSCNGRKSKAVGSDLANDDGY